MSECLYSDRMFAIDPRTCVNRPGAWPHLDERCNVPDAMPPDESWRQYPCVETDWNRDKNGYGKRYIRGSLRDHPRYEKSNRVALEQKLGRPIRPLMYACHRCDNPPCVQPEHLYEGTHAQNMQDKVARGTCHGRGPQITEEVKAEVRRRHAQGGITQQQLVDEFGISKGSVWRALHFVAAGEVIQ